MDIPNDTTELGERTYRVSFLTTKAFYELLALLGNLAGPSISEFLAGVDALGIDGEIEHRIGAGCGGRGVAAASVAA